MVVAAVEPFVVVYYAVVMVVCLLVLFVVYGAVLLMSWNTITLSCFGESCHVQLLPWLHNTQTTLTLQHFKPTLSMLLYLNNLLLLASVHRPV